MELISVIVPVYNLEKYIERTVKSICAQTYRNLEIILVDDGSTDGSLALLRQLAEADPRIRVLHQENAGVTAARFAGINAAAGNRIGFVDGDDLIEPDMYERLLGNALRYGADISHCGYRMVFPDRVDYYYNTGKVLERNTHAAVKDLLEGRFVEPTLCSKLYRKELFDRLPYAAIEEQDIRNMEDLLLNYYLFAAAKSVCYEDFCPYHYMVRAGSAATNALNEHKLRDPVLVFDTIQREIGEDAELTAVVRSRLSGILIQQATMNRSEKPELRNYQLSAQKRLREIAPKLNAGKARAFAYWAAYLPAFYRAVHAIYSRLRGTDKKYRID